MTQPQTMTEGCNRFGLLPILELQRLIRQRLQLLQIEPICISETEEGESPMPEPYEEYADIDQDGMPQWIEPPE